jgi:hypothetical protein
MFTLLLVLPESSRLRQKTWTASAAHVPQIGSTINLKVGGTHKVVHVGQDFDGQTLSSTVYVYLEETD